MIVSIDNEQPSEDFEKILNDSKSLMLTKSKSDPKYYIGQGDADFEVDVYENMKIAARTTSFDGNIELVSGHKFPDIVAKHSIYGVEVKKTNKDHWTSTGNSVLESTRDKDVEKIYIFFGKLASPIDFKYRLYQDCLNDIAVTHSPRYRINMDLKPENTIFKKMGLSYDALRTKKDPLRHFVDYYKKIKKGSEPWWISKEDDEPSPPMISVWSSMEKKEQESMLVESMVLFPEVFGNGKSTKYNRVVIWLVKKYGVVNPALRDEYTSGGQEPVLVGRKIFEKLPKVIFHLNEQLRSILVFLASVSKANIEEIQFYWGDKSVTPKNVVEKWYDKVITNAIKNKGVTSDIMKIILKVK